MTVREPGGSAGILVHENLWAESFATALRRGGAQPVASGRIRADPGGSGRIPVPAVLAALDATDATDAGWRVTGDGWRVAGGGWRVAVNDVEDQVLLGLGLIAVPAAGCRLPGSDMSRRRGPLPPRS